MPEQTPKMTFQEWLEFGFHNGYCSHRVCGNHDGLPASEAEMQEEDYGDLCMPAVRIFDTVSEAKAVMVDQAGFEDYAEMLTERPSA